MHAVVMAIEAASIETSETTANLPNLFVSILLLIIFESAGFINVMEHCSIRFPGQKILRIYYYDQNIEGILAEFSLKMK